MIRSLGNALMTWANTESGALSLKMSAAGTLTVGAFPATADELIWSVPLDEWHTLAVGVSLEKTAHTSGSFPKTDGGGYAKLEAWAICADSEKSLLRLGANFGSGVLQPQITHGNTQTHHDISIQPHILPLAGIGSGYKASAPFIFSSGVANGTLPLPFYRIGYVISIKPDVAATGTETIRWTVNECYTGKKGLA